MDKLNLDVVAQSERQAVAADRAREIGPLQVAVFVMAGGGFLGRMAAEQPADFYIDDRCEDLRYEAEEIEQAVEVLRITAQAQGLDPHKMPAMPEFHACGIF